MKPILINISFFSLFFFISCSTYEPIQIQILKPASINISGDIKKVLFINHAVYTKSSFINNSNETIKNENLDSIRTSEYFNGLYEVFSNSPRFEVVNSNPVYIAKLIYNERFKSLDWNTIDTLCIDSSADAAIVLENFQVQYSPKIPVHYNQEYGYYIGTLEMDNSSLWKIYVPTIHKVEDDYLLMDTLFWDGYGDYENEVLEQLPSIKDAVMQSCNYAGNKYGLRIAQTWETKNRYLIYCENKDFRTAFNLAKQDKWEDAIELWKKYPYGKRKRLAAYAAYNLAVASETLDHLDIALEWASKSYLINKNSYVEKYIKILENRKSEKEVIEKQLN